MIELGKVNVPDMWDVVELGYHTVPMVGAKETIRFLDLGTEMSEDNHGGLVGSKQKRPN